MGRQRWRKLPSKMIPPLIFLREEFLRGKQTKKKKQMKIILKQNLNTTIRVNCAIKYGDGIIISKEKQNKILVR